MRETYLSTFNYPKSGDFTRFTIEASFAVFCLVPILATRGQVRSSAQEWAFMFHLDTKVQSNLNNIINQLLSVQVKLENMKLCDTG